VRCSQDQNKKGRQSTETQPKKDQMWFTHSCKEERLTGRGMLRYTERSQAKRCQGSWGTDAASIPLTLCSGNSAGGCHGVWRDSGSKSWDCWLLSLSFPVPVHYCRQNRVETPRPLSFKHSAYPMSTELHRIIWNLGRTDLPHSPHTVFL
jgi:hypothetical protein